MSADVEEDYYSSENHVTSRDNIKALEPEPNPYDFSRLRHGLSTQVRLWHVFSKQEDALACSRRSKLPLFCYQHQTDNRRCYLVTHPLELLHRCSSQHHTYEVVQKNCKPFAVLEYSIIEYPDLDGDRITSTFCQVFIQVINSNLHLQLSIKDLVILDGSDNTKFYRQIVCQLPQYVSVQSGVSFVIESCNLIRRAVFERGGDSICDTLNTSKSELKQLVLSDLEGHTTLVIKEVNDLVRVVGSCQFNSGTKLLISKNSEYTVNSVNGKLKKELILLASFVTPASFMPIGHPTTAARTNKIVRQPLPAQEQKAAKMYFSGWFMLDNLIITEMSPCQVDTILKYQNGKVLVFCTRQAGYCYNVGRFHKNNRIMYVVLVHRAIYYQKCHDPDCKNFRSKLKFLPYEVQMSMNMTDNWHPHISEAISNTNLNISNPYKRFKPITNLSKTESGSRPEENSPSSTST